MKYYTESHEWVELDGEMASVGVTEYAQKELGEVVYVELPELGRWIESGEEVAVLESTKAAADVYSPVSGMIVEVNEKLLSQAGLVNEQAEGDGWLFRVKMDDVAVSDQLMNEEAYRKMIKG